LPGTPALEANARAAAHENRQVKVMPSRSFPDLMQGRTRRYFPWGGRSAVAATFSVFIHDDHPGNVRNPFDNQP
jgi:hypothetical protein